MLKLCQILLNSESLWAIVQIRVAPDTDMAGYPANSIAGYPNDPKSKIRYIN